jgi:hypothetical protein
MKRSNLTVEDHPLWPKWKACLEKVIAAKEAMVSSATGKQDVARAAVDRYNAALFAYTKISEEI